VSNNDPMAAGVRPEEGQLLYGLVRALRPGCILEMGTGYGYSTIHLAAGCRDNGGGRVHTVEIVPQRQEQARLNVAEAGLAEWVTYHNAPPPDRQYDLVLLDAGHTAEEVRQYLEFVATRIAPDTLVLVHDGCWLNHTRFAAAGQWTAIELPQTSTGGLVLLQQAVRR